MSSTITGHCLCGNVTYSINAPHQGAGICHCEDCRRGSGGPYSVVITVPRSAVILKGDYKIYSTVGTSGKLANRYFCPNCGSQIANYPDAAPEVVYIKAGTLSNDQQQLLDPAAEVFTRGRLPFIKEQYGQQFETA